MLEQDTWDLCLDISGNIALAKPPYARAQDVASAVRLGLGEAYYDTTLGIPYLTRVLGQAPNLQFLKSQMEAAALTVPGIVQARCLFASFAGRALRGEIQVIDVDGVANNVSF